MLHDFDEEFDVLDKFSLGEHILNDSQQGESSQNLNKGDISSIEPKIQNIVATINMGCQVDLRTVALCARNAEYNPRRFAAVVMRIRNPRTTALIFSSGKLVVTGSTTEEEARVASRKHARIVQKLGFPAHFLDFKIQNIVASCDVQFPIRLEGIMSEHAMYCSYEPELFPGLVYRLLQPKVVVLIFVSGKIVFTGAKVRSDIIDAYKAISPILLKYRKDAPSERSS